jgi:hypothetical protein
MPFDRVATTRNFGPRKIGHRPQATQPRERRQAIERYSRHERPRPGKRQEQNFLQQRRTNSWHSWHNRWNTFASPTCAPKPNSARKEGGTVAGRDRARRFHGCVTIEPQLAASAMPPVSANRRNRRCAACPLAKKKRTSNASHHHLHPIMTGVPFAAA